MSADELARAPLEARLKRAEILRWTGVVISIGCIAASKLIEGQEWSFWVWPATLGIGLGFYGKWTGHGIRKELQAREEATPPQPEA